MQAKPVAPHPLAIHNPGSDSRLPPLLQPEAGAVYYVDCNHTLASDSNPGSEELPWLTIQHAADVAQAGDTVYVKAGVYDERVLPQNSGSSGNLITFKAVGNVVMRGFALYGRSHIRIIGFEITGFPSGSNDCGIFLQGASGSEVWGNTIHHIPGAGIRMHPSGPCDNVLIKDNTIQYCGYEQGGGIGINVYGAHNRIEYNDISHVNDYIRLFGDNNVIRNNYFHDSFWADFPGASPHIDGIQHFSDDWYPRALKGALIERNYMSNVPDSHTHYVMLSDNDGLGSSDIIFRHNVGHNLGSYLIIDEEVDNVRVVHNTLVDAHVAYSPKGWTCVSFRDEATGGKVTNNIFYRTSRQGGSVYAADASSQPGFYGDYNLAYDCGDPDEAHGIVGQDPRFVDYDGDSFFLQGDSPARDSGGPLTTANGSGSGDTIDVHEAGYFVDGWGIVEGDQIQIGENAPVRITAIDYENDIISVDRSISWDDGDWVNLAYTGTAPDMGAYEYQGGQSCQLGITLTHPSDGSLVHGLVQVRASVVSTDCVRHVVFFVDGIPQQTVTESPYIYQWDTSGLPLGSQHSLEARAYACYASADMAAGDEVTVTKAPLVLQGQPGDKAIHLDWTVAFTLPVNAAWHIDYYTTTQLTPFTATDSLSATRSYTLTDLTNGEWYTVTLHSMDGVTSIMSDTVCVMPTDKLLYLPLVVRSH